MINKLDFQISFQNYFGGIIAAHEYFRTCSMSLKSFSDNFRIPSAAEIFLLKFQTWLRVK